MRRRDFLNNTGLCIAGLAVMPVSVHSRPNPAKPNVLFIVCDDLNDAVSGMGGHPQAKTPNIERLMKMGVRFTSAYSNAPLCGPSRASFLTGLYPHTTDFYSNKNNWNRMRKCPSLTNAVTFMEHFWNNGYDVYGTGKIYHNMDNEERVWKKQDGTPTYGGNMNWGPWPWDGQCREGFKGPVHPSLPETVGVDTMFASLADVPDVPADPEKGSPGYKGWVLNNKPFRYVSQDDRDLMPDERNAGYAVKQLRMKHDNPFLLCVGFNRPHSPLIAPQKYFDMFPLDTIQLAVSRKDDIRDCAKILTDLPKTCTGKHGFDNYDGIMKGGGIALLKRWTQAYLACVAYVDDQVGKVLDAYEQSPDRDNTYIILASDNGYHMGEKETLFKMTLWEEAGRIPFVVAGPEVAREQTCGQPVSLIDIYPTLLDLCRLPSDPNRKTNTLPLDGHSLKSLLKDPDKGQWTGPEVALTVVANNNKTPEPAERVPEKHHYAVRSKRYRYVLCNNGEEELYDHKSDPYEWNNMAGNPDYAQEKARLREQLIALRSD